MSDHISTLEGARDYAAAQGVTLTPKDLQNIAALQEAERARLAGLKPANVGKRSLVERFNAAYPRFLEALIGAGDVVLMFTRTLIIAFGVPLALVLLLIVEQQRVVHGISLFELDANLATFAAWALVVINLVLELNIHYVEHKAGYEAGRDNRFSLRLWARGAAYTLGMGNDWQPLALSPAQRQRRALRLVTFAILALALAGSMRSVIAQQSGAWYQALENILIGSSLSDMMTWLGGLLFALAAVVTAQVLTRYVAIRTVEIAAGMTTRQGIDAEAVALDAVAAQYIMARVSDKQLKAAAKAGAVLPTNGNGNGHKHEDFLDLEPVYPNGNGRH